MPLTLSLQFPSGRYVAAAWSNRDEVEWPPHPARLCLALVDVLHKSGNQPACREALKWLCQLPPPVVVTPDANSADAQVLDGVYVPQNPSAAEDVKHPRKPRSFPVVFLNPDVPTVFFHWPQTEVPPEHQQPLKELLSRLPRLGHSSSLVIATLSDHSLSETPGMELFHPVRAGEDPEYSLRVNWDGLLESAELAFDAAGRAKERDGHIVKAGLGAKPDKPLRPAASPRGRHDPRHLWQGYARKSQPMSHSSPWDKRIFVLEQSGGDRLGLESTWAVAGVFHKALLDLWSRNYPDIQIPGWLSGHAEAAHGQRSGPSNSCHLAIFPLAFVGARHATGQLMGLALALPEPTALGLDTAEFGILWHRALAALFGTSGLLVLSPPDRAWTLQLRPEESPDPRIALRPLRWTGPETTWTSVTPIILDRHPKPHFEKNPEAWRSSCQSIIRAACGRLGLPEPVRVNVSPYSPLPGVPPALAFPAPKAKSGRPPRFHVHASLQFAEPIEGPLLIGSGRFRGYGLCLPLNPAILEKIQ